MIPPLVNGLLPLGRFGATLSDIETSFVVHPAVAQSTTRATVWADWQQVTANIRDIVPVCVAWLGGSFVTNKLDPDDLDVVYIIDERVLESVRTDRARAKAVAVLASGSLLRQISGARVDTYILGWVPDPDGNGQSPGFTDYTARRGYWDDLWQRKIAGAKTAPRVPADALPQRGYLEVALDGYTA